jgi:hypothetical protein
MTSGLVAISASLEFDGRVEGKNRAGSASKAVITFLDGKARILKAGNSSWQTAASNHTLKSGDKIQVLESGRLELVLDNRILFRLGPASFLELKEIKPYPGEDHYSFKLREGKLWCRVNRELGSGGGCQVETPRAIITVQGTCYDLQVDPSQQTQVRVFKGAVHLYNPLGGNLTDGQKTLKLKEPFRVSGPTRVSLAEWIEVVAQQYQQVLLDPLGRCTISQFDPAAARKEPWVHWNETRDQDGPTLPTPFHK